MARTRVMTSRTNASFSIESQLLADFDAILDREKKDRSEAIREMIERFVQRKKLNPNPQPTLDVRPYPNPWTDDEETWEISGTPTEQLEDMLELGAPRFQKIAEELQKRRES